MLPGLPKQRSACFLCVPGAFQAQGEHNRALSRSLLEVTGSLRASAQASDSRWLTLCSFSALFVDLFASQMLFSNTNALVIMLFDTLDYLSNVAQVVNVFFCALTPYRPNVSSAPPGEHECFISYKCRIVLFSCFSEYVINCTKTVITVNTHETYSTDSLPDTQPTAVLGLFKIQVFKILF